MKRLASLNDWLIFSTDLCRSDPLTSRRNRITEESCNSDLADYQPRVGPRPVVQAARNPFRRGRGRGAGITSL